MKQCYIFVYKEMFQERRSKIAILVSRPVSYDFERMISVFLEDFEISLDVFKNLEDAKTWLKI